jgi:hypothetical protein
MAAEPFEVSITEAEIADLRERLRRTRWPEPEPVDDWSQGFRWLMRRSFAAAGPRTTTSVKWTR